MGSDRDWDTLGKREPYFAVLTEDRYLHENLGDESLEAFFESGERDVELIFELVTEAGGPSRPGSALDFGCGVGRLSFPLARRSDRVIGVDAAASMLERAEMLRRHRGIDNVHFLATAEIDGLDPGSLDFVQSLIVFQHIPVRRGEEILRRLLSLLRAGGWFALELSFERPGGRFRRWLRRARAASPLVHRFICTIRRERDLPYMQMNEYDERRIERIIRSSGGEIVRRHPTDHGGIRGAILIGRTGVCSG